MSEKAIRPEDVFTPRASDVNPHSYISRPDLEDELRICLRMPKHIVIHGESGTGKSWLYKKVLTELGYHFEVANMGLCASAGSISEVLARTIAGEFEAEKKSIHEVNGGVPGILGGKLTTEARSTLSFDPFLVAIEALSNRAQYRSACLIFDNLEQVVLSDVLVQELAGLLLLVDDHKFASKGVKILLVGTSNEIRSLINGAAFSNTIANRLVEIPEVSRLTQTQSLELSKKGLMTLLGCEFNHEGNVDDFEEEEKRFWKLISYHSDRIPQYLQELCLYVAIEASKRSWTLSVSVFLVGLGKWVRSSLVKDLARIEANLNYRGAKIGRRNQVIFCLGECNKYDFNRNDIEEIVAREFPGNCVGSANNIGKELASLSKGSHPIIARSPKNSYYRFNDPKFRIVIRWLMQKDVNSGAIVLRDFESALGLWKGGAPKLEKK